MKTLMGVGTTGSNLGIEGVGMKDVDHNTAVRLIVRTLKGPVAAVFRQIIPQFGDVSGDEFYEMVLARSDMLHGCVSIFHKHREAFDHLVRDEQGRVVRDDFVPLKCGRSIHDVIAMILRTHAKKQFRANLGGDPSDPKSASGRLYAAIKDYLIHDWQISLVPHYAALPVAMVEKMGPSLLELTEACQIIALVSPNALPAAPPVAMIEDHSKEAEYWWETLNDSQVRQTISPTTDGELRELTAAFCHLADATRNDLLAQFGLSLYQAAVLLTLCHRNMGRASFGKMLGKPGNAGAARALGAKLKAAGLSSRTDLKTLARLTDGVLNSMPRAASGGTRQAHVA